MPYPPSVNPATRSANPVTDNARRPADVILSRFETWLQKTARSIAGASSPDVEDLVQEGRIAMWHALETYDPSRGALPSWLVYKARYRMYEAVQGKPWTGQPPRYHGRLGSAEPEHVISLDAPSSRDESSPALADLVPDPRDHMESAGLVYHDHELKAALDSLTPRQRQYVAARFWEGMTTADMKAEIFGYDPSALWNAKGSGARRKLRKILAHLEGVT